jgi:hypothetical protein
MRVGHGCAYHITTKVGESSQTATSVIYYILHSACTYAATAFFSNIDINYDVLFYHIWAMVVFIPWPVLCQRVVVIR